MEPKKPSRPCEEIEKKANNDFADEGGEEEICEEVEADTEEALKEDEDEWEEIVEEEDEADPEIEEDPVEDPEEETEDDKITKDSPRVEEADHYYSVARECIVQRQSNQLLSNQKEESEEREREKNSEESTDCTPTSPSVSNFIIMPISRKRPTPERDSDSQNERDNYSSMKKAKKGNNDKSPSLAASSAGGGRVWCHEDEITVLEGMIEYKNKEGAYPPNDMVALYDFIKWKLLSHLSRTQMYEKVKRLKKKFLINLGRVEDSVEPAFSKPHDYVLFDLSRKIWGDINTNSRRRRRRRGKSTDDNDDDRRKSDSVIRRKKTNRKSRKQPVSEGYNGSSSFIKEVKKEEVTMDDGSEGDFLLKYPFLSEALCKESWGFELADSEKRLLKEKLSSIGNAKAEKFEKEWKEIREQEREICLQKMNLIALQTELMLKGSKNR